MNGSSAHLMVVCLDAGAVDGVPVGTAGAST